MLSTAVLLQWAEPVSVLIAALGVAWAVRSHQKQLEAQMFLALTERYETIMCAFPKDAFATRLASDHRIPPESDELTLAVLRYLNLCSEEFYLWRRGYLPGTLWDIWRAELERMLRTPLLQREWPKLADEFVSYPEFRHFVEAAQPSGTSGESRNTLTLTFETSSAAEG